MKNYFIKNPFSMTEIICTSYSDLILNTLNKIVHETSVFNTIKDCCVIRIVERVYFKLWFFDTYEWVHIIENENDNLSY